MAQRFSVVNINDGEHEIFMRGYVGLDELRKSRLVLGIMSEVPSSKLVPFQIQHCLFLDYPGIDKDMSHEDLHKLIDLYDDLVEEEYIYLDEIVDLELPGLDTSDDIFIEEWNV